MKTKCIIIEDEPLAREVIETYLLNFPEIELISAFDNAIQAFQFLQNNQIDLIFLDIQMPQLSGIEFLKSLTSPPKVIITTAYRDYAIEGFELNVIDYLLKPIPLERFMKSIDKFHKSISTGKKTSGSSLITPSNDSIYVLADRKQIKIFFDEILYIESMKDYVIIYKPNQKVITKTTINSLEETLPPDKFMRIHRSFIISKSKINAITKTSVEIGKHELPIGRSYKVSVFADLGLPE